ncbi:MAG: hypothetical protein M3Z08_14020 [Chloroflexota bacterium]|nr:hypothetical protein [Chloroflexota bacterium]
MAVVEPTAVVGIFTERTTAENTIQDLRQAGFSDECMGFIMRDTISPIDGQLAPEVKSGPDATTSAVTGGVVGGLLGAAAAFLIPGLGPAIAGGVLTTLGGAALGAATGTVVSTLISIGIPEEEAHTYQQAFESGHAIVIVQADDRYQDAFQIMRQRQTEETAMLVPAPESHETQELVAPVPPSAHAESRETQALETLAPSPSDAHPVSQQESHISSE